MTAKPLIRASFFTQKSIKQSIKVKNRLYKDIIKTTNIQLCQIKEKSFKKYHNKIVDLKKNKQKVALPEIFWRKQEQF